MVNYLPRPDLPQVLIDALQDKSYHEELKEYFDTLDPETRKLFKISTTTLPRAPRQRILYERHSHRVWVDPISNFWKLYGNLIHLLLEQHGGIGNIVEKRIGLNLEVGDTMVHLHGKPDWYGTEERKETDYKFTSVWSYICGDHEEHKAQLNVNAFLLRNVLGQKVEALQNLYMFRDWKKQDAARIPNYPKEQVLVVPCEVWTDERVLEYIRDRISAHIENNPRKDEDLTPCTPEERWEAEPLFKIIKINPKTGEPQKVSKYRSRDKKECEDWVEVETKKKDEKFIIRESKGFPKKCAEFCEISRYCIQYQQEIKEFAQQAEENEREKE